MAELKSKLNILRILKENRNSQQESEIKATDSGLEQAGDTPSLARVPGMEDCAPRQRLR